MATVCAGRLALVAFSNRTVWLVTPPGWIQAGVPKPVVDLSFGS